MAELVSKEQAWSLNRHVAQVIACGLQLLMSDLHGYPPEFEPAGDISGDLAMKNWVTTLEQMKEGFELYGKEEIDGGDRRIKIALDLFKEHFFDLWD